MLYCTVLYCTVLCCTVLYCTVLYCHVMIHCAQWDCQYSQTSLIRIPRHPEDNRWLLTYIMSCIHTVHVCVFDYPIPSPIRIFVENEWVWWCARSDCTYALTSCCCTTTCSCRLVYCRLQCHVMTQSAPDGLRMYPPNCDHVVLHVAAYSLVTPVSPAAHARPMSL